MIGASRDLLFFDTPRSEVAATLRRIPPPDREESVMGQHELFAELIGFITVATGLAYTAGLF